MTYRPTEEFFGPPFVQRVPSLIHLGVAVFVVILVISVQNGPKGTELYRYMFREAHLIEAPVVAIFFVVSAVASALRAGMRGVRVRGDWIEYRDMISSVIPKVRRIRWAQIDQLHLGAKLITLDLWDGSRDSLPLVRDLAGLSRLLERVALARAIPVRGGAGLDDLTDLEPPEED